MAWLILWTLVQIVVGIALVRYNWTDVKRLLLGEYELMDTFESVFGLFMGIGLVGSPIWLAVSIYPEQEWYLSAFVALTIGAAGMFLAIILNTLIWLVIGLVFVVTYPLTKSGREQRKVHHDDWDWD